MSDVLESILTARRRAVDAAKRARPLADLEAVLKQQDRPRDFFGALSSEDRIAVIAEMKRKSPSAGEIRPEFDPADIARAYEAGGAAALSVLTEPDQFGGRLDDLSFARTACELPVLRKDFIIDVYQVAEARAAGADAVLLIAEALSPPDLKRLVQAAHHYRVEPLVEVFSEASVPAAIEAGSRMIGINTRNLRTLEMAPDNVERLAPMFPANRTIVAESGIKSRADLVRFPARVSAVLVGESLLRQADLTKAVAALAGAGENARQ